VSCNGKRYFSVSKIVPKSTKPVETDYSLFIVSVDVQYFDKMAYGTLKCRDVYDFASFFFRWIFWKLALMEIRCMNFVLNVLKFNSSYIRIFLP